MTPPPANSPPAYPATPSQRLYRICEDGMCIGCGLCQSVAGQDVVQMQVVTNGYERPVVVGNLTHEVMDRIMDVCPATRVEGLPQSEINADTQHDLVWGPYQQMFLGYAGDAEVRYRASTGGVLTALGMYLVDSGEVEFILHARASSAVPSFGESAISHTSEQVLDGAGSRYGPTAVLTAVVALLEQGRKFAFVGKPCDVAALRNLAHGDDRVDALVKYMLTPVCGGFMPPAGMTNFLRRLGLQPEQVTKLRYRGYGCPGATRVETVSGEAIEATYQELWGTDPSMWQLPFRCKVCPDGIGDAADVVAADTWPDAAPDPATEQDDLGTNAVIVRTARGMELVQRAVDAGYLVREEAVDPRYMDSVQPHQRRKKYAVGARFEGLRAEGKTVPRTARLRLDELMSQLGEQEAARQREGTRERIRAGKSSEPTPSAGAKV